MYWSGLGCYGASRFLHQVSDKQIRDSGQALPNVPLFHGHQAELGEPWGLPDLHSESECRGLSSSQETGRKSAQVFLSSGRCTSTSSLAISSQATSHSFGWSGNSSRERPGDGSSTVDISGRYFSLSLVLSDGRQVQGIWSQPHWHWYISNKEKWYISNKEKYGMSPYVSDLCVRYLTAISIVFQMDSKVVVSWLARQESSQFYWFLLSIAVNIASP